MIDYKVYVNNGVEAFGTEGKTITVNEDVRTIGGKFLAEECHHENPLVPVQVIASVLENFSKTAARLMGEGFALQFKNGEDVMMRIYPDVHIKGGNINLQRAQELDPTVTEITTENAGDLVSKAGITVRAYAECEKKFTDMLLAESTGINRKEIVEKAKVMKKDSTETPSGNENTNPTNPTTNSGDEMEP